MAMMRFKKGAINPKKITAAFSVVALVAGFLFLDKGITGNIILNGHYPFDVISFIGLLLVFCSAILAGYSLRK